MPDNPATDETGQRKAKKSSQPTNSYLFLVSGLAVFLLALILGLGFRPLDPVQAVVAPALNTNRVASPERIEKNTTQLRKVAATIKSSETIEQALELIGKFDGAPVDRLLTADRFQRDFKVSVRMADAGGRSEIVLDYQGTASGAPELVNQLAQTAVQQYERMFEQPARQEHYQAQQEATSAERKASSIRRRYEEFISRVKASSKSSDIAQAEQNAQFELSRVEQQNAVANIAPMIENPAWRELSDQEQRLSAKRLRFLETMTVEHPAIRQLDVDLAQIDEQRSKTPRLIDNPAYLAAAKSQTESVPAEEIASPSLAEQDQDQLAAEIEKLRAESTAADKLAAQRQIELQASTVELNAVQAGRLDVIRWAEKPAVIRGSDVITLVVAALLAWLVGSAVAARGMPADPTIADADEAAQLLGAPVMSVLPADEDSPKAFEAELPRSTFMVARASELALAAMLFLAVTLLVADDTFRTQLMSHPLSSIPLGIERMRELMLS